MSITRNQYTIIVTIYWRNGIIVSFNPDRACKGKDSEVDLRVDSTVLTDTNRQSSLIPRVCRWLF
jgi:hypothetical protein